MKGPKLIFKEEMERRGFFVTYNEVTKNNGVSVTCARITLAPNNKTAISFSGFEDVVASNAFDDFAIKCREGLCDAEPKVIGVTKIVVNKYINDLSSVPHRIIENTDLAVTLGVVFSIKEERGIARVTSSSLLDAYGISEDEAWETAGCEPFVAPL